MKPTVLAAALALLLAAQAEAAERIVSVGAAATEILWRLGAQAAVVGVDTTSVEPAEALASRPNVGYFRQLSAEGLLSLGPDLVIAVGGAGPRETLEAVTRAGVRVETLPDDWSEAGVVARIERIGAAIGRPERAAAEAAAVRADFARLDGRRREICGGPRAMFVLTFQNGRPLVAGRGTAADAMLRLAGATNVADGFDGYKPMTDEAVIEAAPEVVVTTLEGPGGVSAERLFSAPAFAGTPAAKAKRFVALDARAALAFGPRTPAIAEGLLEKLWARK
jgi:iron complex transport system substrate-binding protein